MFTLLFTIVTVGTSVTQAPISPLERDGMNCSAPRLLSNDARQTVRICERAVSK